MLTKGPLPFPARLTIASLKHSIGGTIYVEKLEKGKPMQKKIKQREWEEQRERSGPYMVYPNQAMPGSFLAVCVCQQNPVFYLFQVGFLSPTTIRIQKKCETKKF